MSLDPVETNPEHYKVVFENDRVRVLEYTDRPGDRTTPHEHPDSVMHTLSSFRRRLHSGDAQRDVEMPAGHDRLAAGPAACRREHRRHPDRTCSSSSSKGRRQRRLCASAPSDAPGRPVAPAAPGPHSPTVLAVDVPYATRPTGCSSPSAARRRRRSRRRDRGRRGRRAGRVAAAARRARPGARRRGREIRMANPFSAVPTAFRVSAAGRWWYANCAWDAFGICAALHADGRIESVLRGLREAVRVAVDGGEPDDELAALPLPRPGPAVVGRHHLHLEHDESLPVGGARAPVARRPHARRNPAVTTLNALARRVVGRPAGSRLDTALASSRTRRSSTGSASTGAFWQLP